MRIVAILDTMWGEPGDAPPYFKINPLNHSGKRLYDLVGSNSLIVTNACRERVGSAKQHGTPDPNWLKDNLTRLHANFGIDLILACGRIAQDTLTRSGFNVGVPSIQIPHPAARFTWTLEKITETKRLIGMYCKDGSAPIRTKYSQASV